MLILLLLLSNLSAQELIGLGRKRSMQVVRPKFHLLLKCQDSIRDGYAPEKQLRKAHELNAKNQITCAFPYIAAHQLPNRWREIYEITDNHINVYSLEGAKFEVRSDENARVIRVKLNDRFHALTIRSDAKLSTTDFTNNSVFGFNCPAVKNRSYSTTINAVERSDPQTVKKVTDALEFSITNSITPNLIYLWSSQNWSSSRSDLEDRFKEIICECSKADVVTNETLAEIRSKLTNPITKKPMSTEDQERFKKFAEDLKGCKGLYSQL